MPTFIFCREYFLNCWCWCSLVTTCWLFSARNLENNLRGWPTKKLFKVILTFNIYLVALPPVLHNCCCSLHPEKWKGRCRGCYQIHRAQLKWQCPFSPGLGSLSLPGPGPVFCDIINASLQISAEWWYPAAVFLNRRNKETKLCTNQLLDLKVFSRWF